MQPGKGIGLVAHLGLLPELAVFTHNLQDAAEGSICSPATILKWPVIPCTVADTARMQRPILFMRFVDISTVSSVLAESMRLMDHSMHAESRLTHPADILQLLCIGRRGFLSKAELHGCQLISMCQVSPLGAD